MHRSPASGWRHGVPLLPRSPSRCWHSHRSRHSRAHSNLAQPNRCASSCRSPRRHHRFRDTPGRRRGGQNAGPAIVVENKPGAGTVIGVDRWPSRRPMATAFVTVANSFCVNQTLVKKLPYDSAERPAARGADGHVRACAGHAPGSGLKTVADIVAPGQGRAALSYASFGQGTSAHLAGEMLKTPTGRGHRACALQGPGARAGRPAGRAGVDDVWQLARVPHPCAAASWSPWAWRRPALGVRAEHPHAGGAGRKARIQFVERPAGTRRHARRSCSAERRGQQGPDSCLQWPRPSKRRHRRRCRARRRSLPTSSSSEIAALCRGDPQGQHRGRKLRRSPHHG
jgi:hypothetical protein